MKRTILKFATAATAVLSIVAVAPQAAHAKASPGFDSTYNMIYGFDGANRFAVIGDTSVVVTISQTYGLPARTTVKVDREVCGFWGCSWGNYVGGDCVRDMYVGRTAVCNFNVGSTSNSKHRLVFQKANDLQRVKGTVTVR